MRLLGIALTEVTYTSLISELTRLGELDRIVEVVLGEAEEGIPPVARQPQGNALFPTSAKSIRLNSPSKPLYVTATIQTIQGSSQHSLSQDNKIHNNRVDDKDNRSYVSAPMSSLESEGMIPQGQSPWSTSLPRISAEVAKELVRLLSKAEKVDAALDVLENLVRSEAIPPREAVELVVSAVAGAKELGRAAGLVSKVMLMSHDKPPGHYAEACELLLRASERADGLLKAFEVFSEVQSGSAGESSYVALMEACRKRHNHSAVVLLFESMKKDGVRGTVSYTIYFVFASTVYRKTLTKLNY